VSVRRPPADWRAQAQRALERGRAVDRFIPGALLDSPVSRIGYLYGCTVGWIWGTLWSRGRIERHGRLWVFRGLPSWAFPRGGVCVGNCFLTGDGRTDARLIAHESVHERQWRTYGFLMPVLYALAGRNPLRNRFEIEAGLEDGNYVRRGTR
jgi:hypothetical protein